MTFVSVKYKQDERWSDKSYTYCANLDLHLGERVNAPTVKNPKQEALVVGVNMPEPPFKCREITELWTDEVEGGND